MSDVQRDAGRDELVSGSVHTGAPDCTCGTCDAWVDARVSLAVAGYERVARGLTAEMDSVLDAMRAVIEEPCDAQDRGVLVVLARLLVAVVGSGGDAS